MSAPLRLEFVLSAPDVRLLPDTSAEVAVVGRSNVGKSSLINALAARKRLAQVSKTPGRTQLLNCFAFEAGATLVDCPGYGYAAVSKRTRASWGPMLERYALERDELAMMMVLVDGEVGPTKLDLQMLEWLRASELPHSVIATKHDKVKSSQRRRRKVEVAARCLLEPADVVWVSAAKNTGIDRLRDLVRTWLELA